jgi:hypothetical protein
MSMHKNCSFIPLLIFFTIFVMLTGTACVPSTDMPGEPVILFHDSTSITRITQSFSLQSMELHPILSGANLLPVGWDPSGEWILFDGLGEAHASEVWICRSDGRDLQKVLDISDYPEINTFFSYKQEANRSMYSQWVSNSTIIVSNNSGKYFTYNFTSKEILQVYDKKLAIVSEPGQYWIDQKVQEETMSLVFLSGETYSIPREGYYPSPDGKQVVYLQQNGDENNLLIRRVDKEHGLMNSKEIALLSKDFRIPMWSPDGKFLLFVTNNSSESEPPMYGWCNVFSLGSAKIVYQERCDFGGGYISWLPYTNSDQIGMYTYENKFQVLAISTKEIFIIDGLNKASLPVGATRWIVDSQLITDEAP